MGTIVTEIFSALTEVITGIGTLFSGMFESAVAIFYNADAESGGLTVLGTLLLLGLGVSLFMFAFNFIRRLIKMRG